MRPPRRGDGTTTSRTTPVRVAGLSGAVQVSIGSYHGAAVRSDGTVWTWGYNAYGQLGDGTTTDAKAPRRGHPGGHRRAAHPGGPGPEAGQPHASHHHRQPTSANACASMSPPATRMDTSPPTPP
ncbi:hypothetical protein [Peterkaempfera bronchialis]|uniref:hypothetical protein n=1 Tax=Peterkaempfera bronchialis TaxID=2126346 RepID=UPI003C2B9730